MGSRNRIHREPGYRKPDVLRFGHIPLGQLALRNLRGSAGLE